MQLCSPMAACTHQAQRGEPETLTRYPSCTGLWHPHTPGEKVTKARVSFSCCDHLSFFIPNEPVAVPSQGLHAFCNTNSTTPEKHLFTAKVQ